MIALVWFAISLTAIVLVLLAAGLYVKSNNRQKQDQVYSRLSMEQGENMAVKGGSGLESRNPLVRSITRRLLQAGFEAQSSSILTGLVALAGVAVILAMIFGVMLAGLVMVTLLLIIHLFLLQRAAKRHRALARQLPDFMDRLLRPLIAGNTIEESFAVATRESPEPIRTLFLAVSRQVRFGAPLEEVLARVAGVHELSDLHALAMAVRVNRRYGGNIRHMVKSLMYMARSRETAAQELRALTAETRMSAWMLVAIPVGITTFILVSNPGYYSAMWASQMGRWVLITGFAMQLVGAIVIWRMMRSTEEARV